MRIDKMPVPCKVPKGVDFQESVPTWAAVQLLHEILLAKEEVEEKKNRSEDTYSNGR